MNDAFGKRAGGRTGLHETAATSSTSKIPREKRPNYAAKERYHDRKNIPRTMKQAEAAMIPNEKMLSEKHASKMRSLMNHDTLPSTKDEKRQILLNGRPLVETSSKRSGWKKRVRS